MNSKRRLNCYVFGNLIVSFLTLDLLTNPTSKILVQKISNTTLNKIYEKEEVPTISTPDTIISSGEETIVYKISNNSSKEEKNFNYEKPSYNSVTGTNLVNYAKKFLGLRYVSAGNSLATGTDCSGFTRLIYQEFGISLGRTVSSQIYSGTYVNKADLQPGDLVFYSYGSVASHVAIYIGDGLIIHESTPRDGVKISSVNIMRYITARRLITSNVVNSQPVEPVIETKEEVVEIEQPKEEPIKEKIPVVSEPSEEVVEETKEVVVEETKEEVVEVVETEIQKETLEEVKEKTTNEVSSLETEEIK